MKLKIILFSVVIVGIGVVGLRYWEEVSQKPRVLKAIVELMQDCTQEVYEMEELWSIVESGRTKQSGYLNISHADASILSVLNGIDSNLLQKASVIYDISRDTKSKRMEAKINYSLLQIPMYEAELYVDTQQIAVRIPKLHNSYLRAKTEKLKSQYERSLLYAVFSDQIPSPTQEISLDAFPEKIMKVQKLSDMAGEFSEAHTKELEDYYERIEVEKQSETVQMLINNSYVTLTVYELLLPADMIRLFYEEYVKEGIKGTLDGTLNGTAIEAFIETAAEGISWEEENIPVILYLNGKNQILRMDANVLPMIKGEEIQMAISIYRKGEERLNDKLEIEISALRGNEEWQFLTWVENQWKQEERTVYLQVKVSKPYIMKLLDTKILYEPESGNTALEYALATPLLSLDGEHHLERLSGEIRKPEENVVDIFELDFLELLQFMKGLNY